MDLAMACFRPGEDPLTTLALAHRDDVAHLDEETTLRREYEVACRGEIVLKWWEEYGVHYGGGYTGWWIKDIDADGPPPGLRELFAFIGLELPEVNGPEPPEDHDD